MHFSLINSITWLGVVSCSPIWVAEGELWVCRSLICGVNLHSLVLMIPSLLLCTKASAKENERCTVRFKVCIMNADWPGEGDWTRPVMARTAWQRGKVGVIRLRFNWLHLGAGRCETIDLLIELTCKLHNMVLYAWSIVKNPRSTRHMWILETVFLLC